MEPEPASETVPEVLDSSLTPAALKKISKSVMDISTLSEVSEISKSTTSLFAGGPGAGTSLAGGVFSKLKGKKSKTESKTSLVSSGSPDGSFESLELVRNRECYPKENWWRFFTSIFTGVWLNSAPSLSLLKE